MTENVTPDTKNSYLNISDGNVFLLKLQSVSAFYAKCQQPDSVKSLPAVALLFKELFIQCFSDLQKEIGFVFGKCSVIFYQLTFLWRQYRNIIIFIEKF